MSPRSSIAVTACGKPTVPMKSFMYTPLQGGPPRGAYDHANVLIVKFLAGTLDMHVRPEIEVSAAGAGAKLGRPLEEPALFTIAEKTALSRGKATRLVVTRPRGYTTH